MPFDAFYAWIQRGRVDPAVAARYPGVDFAQVEALLSSFSEVQLRSFLSSSAERTGPTASPPVELLPWFKARARKLKGGIDPAVLARGLSFLSGWSLQEDAGLFWLNGTTASSFDAAFQLRDERGRRVGDPFIAEDYQEGRKGYWAFGRDLLENRGVQVVLAAKNKYNVSSPRVGQLYAASAPEEARWGQTPVYYLRLPAIGVLVYRVTAPDGSSFDILEKPRSPGDPLTSDGFYTWAYARGLDTAAAAILPVLEEELAVQKAALAEQKGRAVCGICFGTYAVHANGDIVQHGYSMHTTYGQGHMGAFKETGDCYGAARVPWHVSPVPAQELLQRLIPQRDRLKASLEAYISGQVRELTEEVRSPRGDPRTKTYIPGETRVVRPGDPKWSTLLARAMAEIGGRLQKVEHQVAFYEEAIAGWPRIPRDAPR